MSEKNPLRQVFWDTFNATRKANAEASNALLAALSSIVPGYMRWIGSWEVAKLAPRNGERRVGEHFVADAEGNIRAMVSMHLDVRDQLGAFPTLSTLEFKAGFIMKRAGASFVLASEFDPGSFCEIDSQSDLYELAQVVLRALEEKVRERATMAAP